MELWNSKMYRTLLPSASEALVDTDGFSHGVYSALEPPGGAYATPESIAGTAGTPGARFHVSVMNGSAIAGTTVAYTFFHEFASASFAAINAIPPVGYDAVAHARARSVIGTVIRPPGHDPENPFAADTDP